MRLFLSQSNVLSMVATDFRQGKIKENQSSGENSIKIPPSKRMKNYLWQPWQKEPMKPAYRRHSHLLCCCWSRCHHDHAPLASLLAGYLHAIHHDLCNPYGSSQIRQTFHCSAYVPLAKNACDCEKNNITTRLPRHEYKLHSYQENTFNPFPFNPFIN